MLIRSLTVVLLSSLFPSSLFAKEIISINSLEWQQIQSKIKAKPVKSLISEPGATRLEISDGEIQKLSTIMHERFHKCGGFFTEEVGLLPPTKATGLAPFEAAFYNIDQNEAVQRFLGDVDELKMLATIQHLSSFKNRYYQSEYGIASQNWIKDTWSQLVKDIPHASVELRHHASFAQPSVILTFRGSKLPNEYIVIGGHGDSILNYSRNPQMKAPGADDNASGIATLTEVLRVLALGNFTPDRSVQFMAYAAEEVGLRGSQDIASDYRRQNMNVKAVMQLDMTNYTSDGADLVLINDNTNSVQNQFMGQLLETYLPSVRWTQDGCGYACSDHASWNRYGYRASFPFEAPMDDYNPNIHSTEDTLAMSGNSASHAAPFAKLGLAFVLELAAQ